MPGKKIQRNGMELESTNNKNNEKHAPVRKGPVTWTIINALNDVLNHAVGSELSDEFFETCKSPLAFLRDKLGLTDVQIVVLAIMIEAGDTVTWKQIADYLCLTRLSVMTFSDEIEDLVAKRWIYHINQSGMNGTWQGFHIVYGVVNALRQNKAFVPQRIDGLTEQEFVDMLGVRIDSHLHNNNFEFIHDEQWMLQITSANPQLPLCREVLSLDNEHDQSLLLMVVADYAQWGGTVHEGLQLSLITEIYDYDYTYHARHMLRDGVHVLMKRGLIEFKCEDGIVNQDEYVLTQKAKNELLAAYSPSKTIFSSQENDDRSLVHHESINEKVLYYNASEQAQIQRLVSLLSVENLPSIQQRLEEQGLRKGFACLFYGGPGTGKTETVLQIARQTGRDIMQVDIAGLRDKFVGESEKNIKQVFDRYRTLCKKSEVMPILFFNEADAIINKRMENIQHSVDKMDNSMQNIILQELENLDGILIATTNLTANLDSAFERRFLFKVEFHKPEANVKAKIWRSMLKDISADDALQLATHFDFSGGQIENVARKRTIDYILNGKYATLEEIEGYCKAELLANKNERKHIAGFTV